MFIANNRHYLLCTIIPDNNIFTRANYEKLIYEGYLAVDL